MADPVPTVPASNGKVRREFVIFIGIALTACMAIQGILMWKLMGENPPDASWDLIKGLLSHLAELDLLLVGGLLGALKPQP